MRHKNSDTSIWTHLSDTKRSFRHKLLQTQKYRLQTQNVVFETQNFVSETQITGFEFQTQSVRHKAVVSQTHF